MVQCYIYFTSDQYIAMLHTSIGIGIGIGITRGQFYSMLDIECLAWYCSNTTLEESTAYAKEKKRLLY